MLCNCDIFVFDIIMLSPRQTFFTDAVIVIADPRCDLRIVEFFSAAYAVETQNQTKLHIPWHFNSHFPADSGLASCLLDFFLLLFQKINFTDNCCTSHSIDSVEVLKGIHCHPGKVLVASFFCSFNRWLLTDGPLLPLFQLFISSTTNLRKV